MSTFGDHTPKQDILEHLEWVKFEHELSWWQIVMMLAEIVVYLMESEERRSQ